jgi:hypothetical protein
MRPAVFMTKEQTAELVAKAKQDPRLWQAFKERELEVERIHAAARAQGKWPDSPDFVIDPPPLRPSFGELLVDLMKSLYGDDFNKYAHGSVALALRREIRLELGLPV